MLHVHVVTHTHWDREWYTTFEIFRRRLVNMVDELLSEMDKHPDFKHFMLDGQVIVLEDYLEIAPDSKEALMESIRKGKIIVGPWYMLPDEFLVSGESLIRNFLYGQKILKELGLPSMKVGYLPDMFGHNAYTPTVLSGLGLKWAVIWRGVGRACRDTEFIWKSPNGDAVKVVNLVEGGYSNAAHFGKPLEELKGRFKETISKISEHATTDNILLMNGTDHEMPLLDLPSKFEEWSKEFGVEMVHSTLEDYISNVEKENPKLKVVSGELRDPKYEPVLKDVTSTRIYLKLLNFEDQILYTRYIEPLAALKPTGETLKSLEIGWKEILRSHPHDSICGCSIDRVHRDVEYRLNKAKEIGIGILANVLKRKRRDGVTVVNLSETNGKYIVEAFVPLTPGIYDMEGSTVWVKPISADELSDIYAIGDNTFLKFLSYLKGFQEAKSVDEVFPLPMGKMECELDLKAMSSKSYKSLKKISDIPKLDGSTDFEGDYYRFKLNADGSFDLFDKRNGVEYPNMNTFLDVADAGDEYNFSPIPSDFPLKPFHLENVSVEPTAFGVDVKVVGFLEIPESLDDSRTKRSENTCKNPVQIVYRLFKNLPRVDIKVKLRNSAKDHKLFVRFTNPESLKEVFNDGYFGLVKHPTKLPPDPDASEEVISRYAMETFVALIGEKAKFMIITRGLHEYETNPEDGTKLDITLLRSVGWLSRDDLKTRKRHAGPPISTPEAQCIGTYNYRYSFVLLETGSSEEMYEHQRRFLVEPLVISPAVEVPSLGFFEAEKGVFLSAMKPSEDGKGVILRFFNVTSQEKRVKINAKFSVVNMAEDLLESASTDEVIVPPGKVLSVKCEI